MNTKLAKSYVFGRLSPVLQITIHNEQELPLALEKFDKSKYQNLRLKVPANVEVIGLNKVYGHFEIKCDKSIEPKPYGYFIKIFTRETIKDSEYADFFEEATKYLVKECRDRLPSEFDKNGKDPSWFVLGKHVMLILSGSTPVGFRVFDYIDNYTKMWFGYVIPSMRGKGVYTLLFKELYSLSKKNNKEYLTVATDLTEGNKMLSILAHLGFELKTITYKNSN